MQETDRRALFQGKKQTKKEGNSETYAQATALGILENEKRWAAIGQRKRRLLKKKEEKKAANPEAPKYDSGKVSNRGKKRIPSKDWQLNA